MALGLPHDQRAEQELVGLALASLGEAYDTASLLVKPDSFYDRTCSLAWASIGKSRGKSETPSVFTLAHDLKGMVDETEVMALDGYGLDPLSLPRWLRIVSEMAQRRAIIAAARAIEASAADVENDHAKMVRGAEKAIYSALAATHKQDAYRPMRETVQEVRVENAHAAAERGRVIGLTTGIESLDRELRGLRPGELCVIGGRTSEGKSSLGLGIARHNAMPARGKRTAYFSCEMTRQDLVRRLVAGEGVSLRDQESFDFCMEPRTNAQLRDAYAAVETMPIEVVYQPGITFAQVRTWLRRFEVDGKIDLVLLDYLGIMGVDESRERRDLDVANFIQQSLSLGAEFRCPVIAIQGLNRKSAHDGKIMRPQLSHLMDASAIEYGAHQVILVHNPNAKLDADETDDNGERELILAKNRRGRRDRTVKTRFLPRRFLFAEEERADDFARSVGGSREHSF